MVETGWNRRLLVRVAIVGALLMLPAAAFSQVGRPAVQNERLLILVPLPDDPADSVFAVQLGDELRSRVEGRTRRRLTVISKDRIGEALEASGFGRDALLDLAASEQLARFLQADAYMIGRWERNPQPRVAVRLVDLRRSGLSGWIHHQGQAGATPRELADGIASEMDKHVRAAERTRECYERRDRRDFNGAKDRARRAFTEVPNHPQAAMCLAVIYEVERAPADSQIAVLEMAVQGDSLNSRAWDMLGRQYQLAGDSLKGAEAFAQQLKADPSDQRLRAGVSALFITLRQYERARDLLGEGLERNPTDLQLHQLKARACEDGSLWPCLVEALEAQYELDSTVAGSAEFYSKIFGAAQSAEDTTAMLKWSAEAVRQVPNSVALWRGRAYALTAAGMADSALAAYRRIMELEPADIGSQIRVAQILTERVTIDSLVPLDTGRLNEIDSLLTRVARGRSNTAGMPTDTAVWMNVAAMYFGPGAQMVQKRASFEIGARWLEKALRYDVRRQLTAQANFFLGLAYFFPLMELDAQLRETKSCQLVAREAEMVAKAKQALTLGASVQPAMANQLLEYVTQFEALIPEYRRAFECR